MENLTRRSIIAGAAAAASASVLAHALQPEAKPAAGPAFEGDSHRGACIVASVNGLRAVERGMAMMKEGYDPADCIVQGIKIIEDDPNDTSVGLGGEPNFEGIVELDASVMYGPTHKSGAVASIRNIKNPAQVALLVLRRTNHCLLVGEGALRFAKSMGFKEEDLLTEQSRREWQHWRENLSPNDAWLNDDQRDPLTGKPFEQPGQLAKAEVEPDFTYGTVHLSAVTEKGDVASCTSTSGLSWKIPGRVGDSPIIGAGNYCDNAVGGAGCTGRGESAITNLSAYTMVMLMERGMTPAQAAMEAMKRVADRTKEKRLKDAKGRPLFDLKMYAVRKDGAWGGATMCEGGARAVATKDGARAAKVPGLFPARA
ncbi:MAG: N(4)-(beta-N-acetylglucosaminyl)-L-asparaginase [Planctomycetota bacterium]